MRIFSSIIIIFFLTSCTSNYSNILNKKKPGFYSYIIGNIKNSRITHKHAEEVYIIPASCLKTITAALAYKTLGADYQFETKVFINKKDSEIKNVVISFSGDPTFKSSDLSELLKPLKNTKVLGKVILDASYFKTPPYSPNILIGNAGTFSSAPISSIIIDSNIINIDIRPGKQGSFAKIKSDSPVKFDNRIVTTHDPKSAISLTWNGNILKARGTITKLEEPLTFKRHPIEIDNYILSKIKQVMKELNIKGHIYIIYDKDELPKNLVVYNQINSKPLGVILPPALKNSDNLLFDVLFLSISRSVKNDAIEDWTDGDKIYHELIKKYFNIDIEKAWIVDGSGLSSYNRIQAKKLYEILRQSYNIPEFIDSLPKSGENNTTLSNRTLSPNIRAKTGHLAGVNCLCGYNILSNKAFVVVAHNFAPTMQEMNKIIDDFIVKQVK